MIKTICICDKCGREIPPGEKIGYLAWNIRDKLDGDLTQENPYENNHYCLDCMGEIGKFIEDAPKSPRRIDYGKIMALRDAGWTAKAIGEEMKMSESAVYQAISKIKKEKAKAVEAARE